METEQKDRPNNTLAIGNINPSKRGRGRPRGSVNKKIMSVKEVTHNARASRRVDFFSPDTVLKQKVKKRGRPKKIKIPGRPRKIPLTPEEEAERILRFSKQRKRKISKPLGRPRIHPLVVIPKEKRGRGRPQNSTVNGNLKKGFKKISEFGEGIPRKRGRPRGSFKKKRGRPAGSAPTKITSEWNPGKRGRPPGSGIKLKFKEEENGIPRKRGRPPGSGTRIKIIRKETDGTPRKRGRPPGSGNKIKVAQQEPNGASRKRGRPPGSGKSKTDVNDTDRDFSSSALSASDQPRKRGRPSKASSTEASSVSKAEVGLNQVNDSPSPKQARKSFASLENSNKETEMEADDEKASKNNAGIKVAVVETPALPAGSSIVVREVGKQATIEKNCGEQMCSKITRQKR
uniref:Si:ch211-288g17.3 n=1 Tax=Electrophorus electricus TaxID=8005 RepID=A0AAY5EU62_ELEEL